MPPGAHEIEEPPANLAPGGQRGNPDYLKRPEIASGLLATPKLPGFPLKRSWCTVYPKDRPPSPVTELFLRCVRELLPELNRHFSGPLEPMPGHGVVCLPAVDSQQR